MIEEEPINVELSLDTSRFETAVYNARASMIFLFSLDPMTRARLLLQGRMADAYQDFGRAMNRVNEILGEDERGAS